MSEIPQKKKMKPQVALMRLEALCAQSEQCSCDVRQKLYRWGVSSSDSEKIVKQLIDNRFIDDERFAIAYCRDKYRFNHWGRVKIVYGLRAKRISSAHIQKAVTAIDAEEYSDILENLIRSKAKTIKDVDSYEGRTKLFRYAVSRGFESELIANIIKDRSQWLCDK